MLKLALTVLVWSVSLTCFAQDNTTIHARPLVHGPLPTQSGWYPALWAVANLREDATDNFNIFAGIGRKLDNGWVEFMLQRQYSMQSNQWLLDFRFQHRLPGRLTALFEASPFLETKALYTFVRVDHPMLWRLNALVESENVHRSGLDSWGVGPGISIRPINLIGRVRFSPALVWHLRPNDPDFVRFYLGFPL